MNFLIAFDEFTKSIVIRYIMAGIIALMLLISVCLTIYTAFTKIQLAAANRKIESLSSKNTEYETLAKVSDAKMKELANRVEDARSDIKSIESAYSRKIKQLSEITIPGSTCEEQVKNSVDILQGTDK